MRSSTVAVLATLAVLAISVNAAFVSTAAFSVRASLAKASGREGKESCTPLELSQAVFCPEPGPHPLNTHLFTLSAWIHIHSSRLEPICS